MAIQGIDHITYGSADLATCRKFFQDWGLRLASEDAQELVFESLNGCRVVVAHSDKPGLPAGIEPDPTLREVVWGVDDGTGLASIRQAIAARPDFIDGGHRIGCTDPNGVAVRFQVSVKTPVDLKVTRGNTWDLDRFAGLAQRKPAWGLAMAAFMLSLGGLPPTIGFKGKLLIFRAGVDAGLLGLAILGVLASAAGVYYYLRVVVYMFMRPAADGVPALERAWTTELALAVCHPGMPLWRPVHP